MKEKILRALSAVGLSAAVCISAVTVTAFAASADAGRTTIAPADITVDYKNQKLIIDEGSKDYKVLKEGGDGSGYCG